MVGPCQELAPKVYVRGLDSEPERAQIRRLSPLKEREEARRRLRAQRYGAACVRLRQLRRPLTEGELWEMGYRGVEQAKAILQDESEEEAKLQSRFYEKVHPNLSPLVEQQPEVEVNRKREDSQRNFWESFVAALDAAEAELQSACEQPKTRGKRTRCRKRRATQTTS